MGAVAGARVDQYNLGTSGGKCKVFVRVGKHKLGARAGKCKFGSGLVHTNWGSRPVNINWGPGPGAKQRAGFREIQRALFVLILGF